MPLPVPGQPKILIAEDDPDLAQDLIDRLTGSRYSVLCVASSGQDAVSIAASQRPDLVLMDIQLSGQMDGVEAAGRIRELRIPIVFVTGFSAGSTFERAVSMEPYGYVVKPYSTADLKIAVDVALSRHGAERERDLLLNRFQELVSNLKTLKGRLSICGYCKKIKDDEGQWPEIEAYVMKHSYASFSHGMCPDCFARMKKQLEDVEKGDVVSNSLVLG
jgi:CheY-like chemotaxis protein